MWCPSPWNRTPLPKSFQDPSSKQWDHEFPLLEESTELTAFPFPQNKQVTVSPSPRLSCERGNVQNTRAVARMCDSHGSLASRAGAGLLACGFQPPVILPLWFLCLLCEIQPRQQLLVEVTTASTAQQTSVCDILAVARVLYPAWGLPSPLIVPDTHHCSCVSGVAKYPQ